MNVLVYGQRVKSKDLDVIQFIFEELSRLGFNYFLFDKYQKQLPDYLRINKKGQVSSISELREHNIDFILSLGGDGTILSTINFIKQSVTPIVGINLGRLGFLAIVNKKNITAALEKIRAKQYSIEERSMLELTSNGLFDDFPYALNDLTIHKRDTSSMIKVNAWINGSFLKAYWADGVILSTPTGSTGYSLSCGGPIIFPSAKNFVLTAVAPHNLTSRPIVIPDDSQIKLTVEGRSNNYLCTMDSRYQTINSDHELIIKKANFNTQLIRLDGSDFLNTLHEKMMWGLDNRNT